MRSPSGPRRFSLLSLLFRPLLPPLLILLLLLSTSRCRPPRRSSSSCCVSGFVLTDKAVRRGGFPVTCTGSSSSSSSSTALGAIGNQKLTSLPAGISPFEKSVAKGLDVQGKFRQLASQAIDRAAKDGRRLIELDFPPLLGGRASKTQFDDFDNVQELDANRDWCAQLAPSIAGPQRRVWLVFPDDKECELASKEWSGQRFRSAAKFTSIRAACEAAIGPDEYDARGAKAWGSTFAAAFNKLGGGDGILADSSYLDDLDADGGDSSGKRFHLVCQPGNGGPVEDWINVEQLHEADGSAVTCVVNGALDKVRDGYYPALFFPALAKSVPFYRSFEAVFYLKPISDKGVYGWLFRCYPEPWQVVLQAPRTVQRGKKDVVVVEEKVALVSQDRPTYDQAVRALLNEASKSN